MQAAITYLQNQLTVLETNAPINEREGSHEQAALELSSAAEIRDALTLLLNAEKIRDVLELLIDDEFIKLNRIMCGYQSC